MAVGLAQMVPVCWQFQLSKSGTRQFTSDSPLRQGIDPNFGCQSDCGAVGSIFVVDIMVSVGYLTTIPCK